MLRGRRRLPQGEKHGGAPHGHRGLLVAWQMCDRCLVDPPSRVDVYGVDHLKGWLAAFVRVLGMVLARGRKKQAPIGSEGQPAEKRGECFVRVEASVLEAEAVARVVVWFWGCLHRHHGR